MLTIPEVFQRHEFDCGPACIRAVCRYFRVRCGDAGLSLAHPVCGMECDTIAAVLRSRGLQAFAGRLPLGVSDLHHYTRGGCPVLCPITTEMGAGHWVVVRGVRRGRVYVADPSRGYRSLPIRDWMDGWHDFSVSGYECRQWGVVVSK